MEDGRLGGSATPGARGRQASRMPPGCSAARGRCSTHPRLAVTASGTHWCPAHTAPTTGTGTLDFGPSGPRVLSQRGRARQRLTQVALPPREAREAGAGVRGVARDTVINARAAVAAWAQGQAHGGCGHRTEQSRQPLPSLTRRPVPEAWPAAHGRPGGQGFALRSVRECRCDRGPPSARASRRHWDLCAGTLAAARGGGAFPESLTPTAPSYPAMRQLPSSSWGLRRQGLRMLSNTATPPAWTRGSPHGPGSRGGPEGSCSSSRLPRAGTGTQHQLPVSETRASGSEPSKPVSPSVACWPGRTSRGPQRPPAPTPGPLGQEANRTWPMES